MEDEEEILYAGKVLAKLIEQLPPEERGYYQRGIAGFVHDIRQSLCIIFTANALLRRKVNLSDEEIELLNAIDTANKRALFLVTDFAKPLDSNITIPLGKRPDLPNLDC
ncbi:MAG: hypothetical protein JW726_14810 [Anaerolineales bacterium]|nr:hypothetical protein [Anaerolineales bacterium]